MSLEERAEFLLGRMWSGSIYGARTCSRCHSEFMSDYEIVIHLREPGAPLRIQLTGVEGDAAELDRQKLKYEIEEARLAEVPMMVLKTLSGLPGESMAVDPREVTEVDLVESIVDAPLDVPEQ